MLTLLTVRTTFSAPLESDALPDLTPSVPVEITDRKFWRSYRVCYPPFNWSLPRGLTRRTLSLFWKQPENKRHFLDTNASEHCGVFRLISNGRINLPYPVISNETHFINTESPAQRTRRPVGGFLLILTGHWGHYFQHFFDNIGPQIALALDVLGRDPSNLTVIADLAPPAFPNVPQLWNRIGFAEVFGSENRLYSAGLLGMIESTPRVHPHFFTKLRDLMRLPERAPTKIIWISRKRANSYYQQRFIDNQDDVVKQLTRLYGAKRVVLFDHRRYTLNETIELFASAKAIIGAHGGGLYNQFFAPKECVIVEVMPVKKNGLYAEQRNAHEEPSFSHMAVWSNSLLIGQEFWRYYVVTSAPSFSINITDFTAFLAGIPRLGD
jgi:hypothetical protein